MPPQLTRFRALEAAAAPVVPPPDAPSGPTPADTAEDVAVTADLDWADAAGADTYDVYFGTANPPPLVASDVAVSAYTLATLDYGTTYFWKIVAKNAGGSTAGPVWSFTTAFWQTLVVDVGIIDPANYRMTFNAPVTAVEIGDANIELLVGGSWMAVENATQVTALMVDMYTAGEGGPTATQWRITATPICVLATPGTVIVVPQNGNVI